MMINCKTLVATALFLFAGNLSAQSLPDNYFSQSFQLGDTEKTMKVEQFRKEGIQTIFITTEGFPNEFMKRIEADAPIVETRITDLDDNGLNEYWLIPSGAGSGGYVYLNVFQETPDGGLVEVPLVADLKNAYHGYRGGDKFTFETDKVFNSFSVYNFDDANCCPTAGKRTVEFILTDVKGKPTLKPISYYGN